MTAPLRPMNLGEILDRPLQIYRARFLGFVGIAAIPVLAMRCISVADSVWSHSHSLVHPVGQPGISLWNFVVGLAFYHVSSFFALLMEPAHIKLASTSVLAETISFRSALRFAATRWRGYLRIVFLKLSANLLGPEAVLVGLMFGIGGLENAAGLLEGGADWPFVLLFSAPTVVGIYLFLRMGACLSLAMPVAALENLTGLGALRRSWKLTRDSRLRIMFTWLAIFTVVVTAAALTRLVLWELMCLMGSWLHLVQLARQLYLPAAEIALTIIYVLLGPIFPIALTLFYYDQRIRHEGFDIERMMDAAGLNPPAMLAAEESAAAQQTPPPTEEETLA